LGSTAGIAFALIMQVPAIGLDLGRGPGSAHLAQLLSFADWVWALIFAAADQSKRRKVGN
jgi:hypothetical protein